MSVYVALLRGVNVGGHNKLPMSDLRRIAADCGFDTPRTLIQSGNLIFGSPRNDATAIAADLRLAVRQATSLDPAVIVRSQAELQAVVDSNPFLSEDSDVDPTFLHVVFRDQPGPIDVLDQLDLAAYAPERVVVRPGEVYLCLPAGVGRSKLVLDVNRQKAIASGTMRNWRTVTTLLQMTLDATASD